MYQTFSAIRTFKKIALLIIAGILFILTTASLLAYFYQDKIVRHFLDEANQYLKTPVTVEQIDFSFILKFPQASIRLHNINIQEDVQGSSLPLCKAEELFLTFNIWDILNQRYLIKQVHLKNGEVNLRITKTGLANYNIFKPSTGTENTLSLSLDKIKLRNVLIRYADQQIKHTYTLLANDVDAALLINGDVYEIALNGAIHSEKIQVEEDQFFTNQALLIKSNLVYDYDERSLEIESSTLETSGTRFLVSGFVNHAQKLQLNLQVSTNATNMGTMLSLLPDSYTESIKKYQSQGDIYFDATIMGEMSAYRNPQVQVRFGAKNASIFQPELSKKLEQVRFDGTFTNGNRQALLTSKLELKNLEVTLDRKSITGYLILENFNDFRIDCQLSGELEAKSVLQFYLIPSVQEAKGLIQFQVGLKGRINDLKHRSTASKIFTTGELNVVDLNFSLKDNNLPFTNFNGNFLFNRNDLAISDFKAKIGSSDFLLNGFFKNVTAYLLFDNEPLGIEADLHSSFINLDELLSGETNTPKGAQEYSLNISPRVQLIFNCKIDNLAFRQFKGRQIRGKLFVKDQVATLNNGQFQAGGGKVRLSGKLDQRFANTSIIDAEGHLERIDVDSIFYVFENFRQDWLIDKNLKGQIYADGQVHIVFDQQLNYKPEQFIADVSVSIKNGELNNFAPMQELSKYVDEGSLARLRFSDLKNEIHIAHQTIYIPEMEISSNVTNLKVSGTHTFDQQIDYSIVVPLRAGKRIDKDEAFGAIEDDGRGRMQLFLTIKGTTDSYKIAYDTRKVRQKVKNDIKKEGQELKEIFKNKGKKKEEEQKQLKEEEYFDFEEL